MQQLSGLTRLESLYESLTNGYTPVGPLELAVVEKKWRGIEYDRYGGVITNDKGSKGEFGGTNLDVSWFTAVGLDSLNNIFGAKEEEKPKDAMARGAWRSANAPNGVYLHGGVGCGETQIHIIAASEPLSES